MSGFLRFLERNIFWVGFLAGTVFWWLVQLLRPAWGAFRQYLWERSLLNRESWTTKLEQRLRDDLVPYLQRQHMAESLFSLDEIAIEPALMAPPPRLDPGEAPAIQDITDILPYLADWPQLASFYGGRRLSFPEAVSTGAHLAITGRPGIGKTFSLAHLAIQLARREYHEGRLENILPVWINAAILPTISVEQNDPFDQIYQALALIAKKPLETRSRPHLQEMGNEGNLLLLIDNFDSMTAQDSYHFTTWIKSVKNKYPEIQMIIGVRDDFYADLLQIGFTPLAVSAWDQQQTQHYLTKWRSLWEQHIDPDPKVDGFLLNAWINRLDALDTPFELTLKIWGLYTGNLSGHTQPDILQGAVERYLAGLETGRAAIEELAFQALSRNKALFPLNDALTWIDQHTIESFKAVDADSAEQVPIPLKTAPLDEKLTKNSQLLRELVTRGLLVEINPNQLGFSHVLIFSYLAACQASRKNMPFIDTDRPGWLVSNQMTKILCTGFNHIEIIDQVLQADREPLHSPLLDIGHWLLNTSENTTWRPKLMRALASLVQSDQNPFGLRARALMAMISSNVQGIQTFLKQQISSIHAHQRMLGVLGFGLLRDTKAVEDLIGLLHDSSLDVQRAVCLSLVAIGNRVALETVADAILDDDINLRQAAAEALANHEEQGHPTLQEAATIDDAKIRRAAVHGLRRLRKLPWAMTILEKLRLEDPQWLVKDAANQALEVSENIADGLYKPLSPLWQIPWLIAFAGQMGIGVPPGSAAHEILLMAVKDGNTEQRIAAMHIIEQLGEVREISGLYQNIKSDIPALREAAYDTLLNLSRSGIELPH
jgi:HEAT repeat protein